MYAVGCIRKEGDIGVSLVWSCHVPVTRDSLTTTFSLSFFCPLYKEVRTLLIYFPQLLIIIQIDYILMRQRLSLYVHCGKI